MVLLFSVSKLTRIKEPLLPKRFVTSISFLKLFPIFSKKESSKQDLDSLNQEETSDEFENTNGTYEVDNSSNENDESNTNLNEETSNQSSSPGFLQSAFSSITKKKISDSDFENLWAENASYFAHK